MRPRPGVIAGHGVGPTTRGGRSGRALVHDELVSFRSVNYPDRFIRANNEFMGRITPLASAVDESDATFRVVPGLNGQPGTTSFESVAYPGHYLRHQGFELELHRRGDTDLYRQDATFLPAPGLADAGAISFESVNYRGYFIRHRNFELHIDPVDGSDLSRADTTFVPVPHGDPCAARCRS